MAESAATLHGELDATGGGWGQVVVVDAEGRIARLSQHPSAHLKGTLTAGELLLAEGDEWVAGALDEVATASPSRSV